MEPDFQASRSLEILRYHLIEIQDWKKFSRLVSHYAGWIKGKNPHQLLCAFVANMCELLLFKVQYSLSLQSDRAESRNCLPH